MGLVADELRWMTEAEPMLKALDQEIGWTLAKYVDPGAGVKRPRAGNRRPPQAKPQPRQPAKQSGNSSGKHWSRGRGRGMNDLVGNAQAVQHKTPKPISDPGQSTLPAKQRAKLTREGWDFHGGKWWPPGHPQNHRNDPRAQHPNSQHATPKEVKQTAMNVLRVLGYGKGSPEDRLRAFQRKHGLDQSGVPDRATLLAMRTEVARVRNKRAKVRATGGRVPKKRGNKTKEKLHSPTKADRHKKPTGQPKSKPRKRRARASGP